VHDHEPIGRRSFADPYLAADEKLHSAVLKTPATVDPATRHGAYTGKRLPDPLGGYLEKVRRHAYRVEDADVDRLHDAGYTDDQIFEVTIAAALGAGAVRLRAGLTALNQALA
jgi:alkylhydroperoxidase family enzyme